MAQPIPGVGTTRDEVTRRVAERAKHVTAEDVQNTCSFARAERLFASEYHGRFLIELLQNAADAWRKSAPEGERSAVRIIIDRDGPALVVANKGEPFPAQVVLESLGHIGRSTKPEGQAIGHKGIGFKSVLEISRAPELYSGLTPEADPELAVRFDAAAALQQITESSLMWQAHLDDVDDIADPIEAVPVLRFPIWVEEPPALIRELATEGFTTVVRLPCLADDSTSWLSKVHEAIEDITDQMLLLLGTFDEVVIDDRVAGTSTTVSPLWNRARQAGAGVTMEEVEVWRDDSLSTHWWLYQASMEGTEGLAGETAVGIRMASGLPADGHFTLTSPLDGSPSAPFHLYFPTRISSGLPFLLHGYFEVNAARTGFYEGSATRNEKVLDALAALTAVAVADLAASRVVDLVSLAEALAVTNPPDDPTAKAFRDDALSRLDDIHWAPTADDPASGRAGGVTPTTLLLCGDERIDSAVASTFPAAYVSSRTSKQLPSPRLSVTARNWLQARPSKTPRNTWDDLGALMRPGQAAPWQPGEEDDGFLHLLDLVQAMEMFDRVRAEKLLAELRGDDDARLLPVALGDGRRLLLPLPDPGAATTGRPSTLVMGRVRSTKAAPLIPPGVMKVAFLPDGLLASEADGDRAKPLGVRPFTVDTVLDRLNALEGQPGTPDVVTFLWTLLARERASEYGTAAATRQASVYDPAAWFWCKPDRGEASENDRSRQRRQRLLSTVLLPARDGTWRPAGTLAFGADWAEWIDDGLQPLDQAMQLRASVYRALDEVAPDSAKLLAAPEAVLALLPALAMSDQVAGSDAAEADEQAGVTDDDTSYLSVDSSVEQEVNRERHAFLLRLGVAEVIPVEGHYSRVQGEATARPWRVEREQLSSGVDSQPWNFGRYNWSGQQHHHISVDEDFRLQWPLQAASAATRRRINEVVAAGADFYFRLATRSAFCPGCSDSSTGHTRRYRTAPEERRPSTLALQLRHSRWIAATLAGDQVSEGLTASEVWWAERPPGAAGMQTSPLRFLPLLDNDVPRSTNLRSLLDLSDIAHAPAPRLLALLRGLRHRVEVGELPEPGTSGSRSALVGLHRLAYERLSELGAAGSDGLADVGLLCEFDGSLVFRTTEEARHDDGRFATYRRHFSSSIPFACLARDRSQTARQLGLAPFEVTLKRRGDEEGTDVTSELASSLTDRIPEILAILTHHSLGSQTLDPASEDFARRYRRLRALRVRKVSDLVLDLRAEDGEATVTLGEDSAHDVFLDRTITAEPVVYHDLEGEDWIMRLRPRLATPLALVVENPAYAATFQLLMLAETEQDRDNVLHDLGISDADIESIRSGLGAVTDQDERSFRRWFAALLTVSSGNEIHAADVDLTVAALAKSLVDSGLEPAAARTLSAAGGGPAVRTQRSGVLDTVSAARVDLGHLHDALRALGDEGLQITASRSIMREWLTAHSRRVVAVIAPRVGPDQAKSIVASWRPPVSLAFSLHPRIQDVLEPVVAQLRQLGLDPDAERLAASPEAELTRLAGLTEIADLDASAVPYYDEQESRRVLANLARAWRRELLLLALLNRCAPGESRASIRDQADTIQRETLPTHSIPSAFLDSLGALLPDAPGLVEKLSELLVDRITAPPPERRMLLALALEHGLPTDRADYIEAALAAPVTQLVQQVRDRGAQLSEAALAPSVPRQLVAHEHKPRTTGGPKRVAAVKVDASHDRRKRALGAEGEAWAIAATVNAMLALTTEARAEALLTISEFMGKYWAGNAVAAAMAHLPGALEANADEEDLIADLVGFLHLSEHSDAFGFDMLGWLDVDESGRPRPVAVEVKSSSTGEFLLSRSEWRWAQHLHDANDGSGYAVLVVRRGGAAGLPTHMDLLVDPVDLVANGRLQKDDDGYRLDYRSDAVAAEAQAQEGH